MPVLHSLLSPCLLFLGGLALFALTGIPAATYAGEPITAALPSALSAPPASGTAPAQNAQQAPPGAGGATSPPTGLAGDQGQQLIQQKLEQMYYEAEDTIGPEPIYTTGYLLDLYRKNQFHPLWTNPDNISQLIAAIGASGDEGDRKSVV